MANGANKDQRNVVIGAMAAGIVLVVVLWLAGVFSGTEEPDIEGPQTEATTPQPEAEEPVQQQ